MGLKEGLQLFTMLGTAVGTAHGVNLELEVLQAQLLKHLHCQQDNFGIHIGTGHAQCLHAKLVEFAQTTSLRAVIAEHGADIEKFGC